MRLSKCKLQLQGMNLLKDWPSGSCDINPIEHIWHALKQAVANRGPYGVEDLRKFVLEEFLKLPDSMIENEVMSFKSRLKQCVANKGGAVR